MGVKVTKAAINLREELAKINQNDSDVVYLNTAPAAPETLVLTTISETIEVKFDKSETDDVDRYEVWTSLDDVRYDPIGVVDRAQAVTTMALIDDTFETAGTIYYKVYALKNGVYSAALSGSQVFTAPVLDVNTLAIDPTLEGYAITYEYPTSRFYAGVEIWHHAHAVQGSLLRASASLVYSGEADNQYYGVSQVDTDYHQFWVEII